MPFHLPAAIYDLNITSDPVEGVAVMLLVYKGFRRGSIGQPHGSTPRISESASRLTAVRGDQMLDGLTTHQPSVLWTGLDYREHCGVYVHVDGQEAQLRLAVHGLA